MKKLLFILLLLPFIAKSQYVVPQGFFYYDTRQIEYKAPGGYVLYDTAAMFKPSDTAMKPLYPAFKFFTDGTPVYWDGTKWNAFGSGGTETWQQTLINGSNFSQDNSVNGKGFFFFMDSLSSFETDARNNSNDFGFILNNPTQVSLQQGNTALDSGVIFTLSGNHYVNLNTSHSNVPAKFILQSSDSLNVSSPTKIAVWDHDTLKSADIALIPAWRAPLSCAFSATGGAQQLGAGLTGFTQFTGSNLGFTTEANREYVISEDCTIQRLFIHTSGTQPADGTMVCTIRRNFGNTTLIVTIPANSSTTDYSNTTDVISLSAGDVITMQWVNNASSSSLNILSTGVTLVSQDINAWVVILILIPTLFKRKQLKIAA